MNGEGAVNFWLALIAAVRSAAPMAWCRFKSFEPFQAVSSYVKRLVSYLLQVDQVHATYRPYAQAATDSVFGQDEIWYRLSRKSGTFHRGRHNEHVFVFGLALRSREIWVNRKVHSSSNPNHRTVRKRDQLRGMEAI